MKRRKIWPPVDQPVLASYASLHSYMYALYVCRSITPRQLQLLRKSRTQPPRADSKNSKSWCYRKTGRHVGRKSTPAAAVLGLVLVFASRRKHKLGHSCTIIVTTAERIEQHTFQHIWSLASPLTWSRGQQRNNTLVYFESREGVQDFQKLRILENKILHRPDKH